MLAGAVPVALQAEALGASEEGWVGVEAEEEPVGEAVVVLNMASGLGAVWLPKTMPQWRTLCRNSRRPPPAPSPPLASWPPALEMLQARRPEPVDGVAQAHTTPTSTHQHRPCLSRVLPRCVRRPRPPPPHGLHPPHHLRSPHNPLSQAATGLRADEERKSHAGISFEFLAEAAGSMNQNEPHESS